MINKQAEFFVFFYCVVMLIDDGHIAEAVIRIMALL